MEATGKAAGLLDKIIPPRIEDAGLEDCALPPDSIKEAFLKAASAVRSHIFSDSEDGSDADCVNDPWTGLEDSGDKLVGVTPEVDPPGACAAKKGGGLPEVTGEDLVVPGVPEAEEGADKLLEPVQPEMDKGGDACIDGLEGLKIGEKEGKTIKPGTENEEEDDDKPILAEAYV